MGADGVPYYEGNGHASLGFLTWLTAVEILLLVVSLVVLGVAFLMFVRLFGALSPPTKALTWVVGGNFVLAVLLVSFACYQEFFFTRRQYIPQGGAFCHYVNPIVLSLVVFNWLGQPVIAWVTLKTLRNEEVSDGRLRRLYSGCIAFAFVVYVWGVTLSPGRIVNGSFCVMVPRTPDAFDGRSFGAFAGIFSFLASVVLYCKSYCHLQRIKRKLIKDLKRIQHGRATKDEAKEPDVSSIGQQSSSRAGPSEWTGNVASQGQGSVTIGDLESGHSGGLGAESGAENALESDDDSSFDSEDDAPFTYGQLQARTQAARAAVNILLPNRTDDMAERNGPYGIRRRDGRARGRRGGCGPERADGAKPDALDEGGNSGAEGQGPPDAKEPPALWWHRWCRREQKEADPNAEVLELYRKATRALVGRACTLLTAYFLPNYLLQASLAFYKDYRPPADLLPIFGLVFFLGTPVLQTVALLHIGVTVGSNILQFYRQDVAQHEGEAAEPVKEAVAVAAAQLTIDAPRHISAEKEEMTSSLPADFLYERRQDEPATPVVVGAAAGGSGVDPAMDPEKGPTGQVPTGGDARPAPPAFLTLPPGASPVATRRPVARFPAGPLGVSQPSTFRRYAGRGQQKAAPPRPASRQGHMQALSTIYEVAFKSRGRDAAASFRHTMSTPTPPAGATAESAPASGSGGGWVMSAATEKAEHEGGLDERKRAQAVTDNEDGSSDGSNGGGADAVSRATTALQKNMLMQEMLGVKMRSSSGSGSSASADSCTSSSVGGCFVASSLSDDLSNGSGSGPNRANVHTHAHAHAQNYVPWRGYPRSRSRSLAEQSEISSLTDYQDYQNGSLGTSPSLTPWGPHALSPARAKRPGWVNNPVRAKQPSYSSGEEGGTSSENPSSGSSGGGSGGVVDSWADRGPLGGGGMSVACMSLVSGSSGGSSNSSSLLSDGGRSIVTESDWKEWQGKTIGGVAALGVDGQQQAQKVVLGEGQQVHGTIPN